MEEDLAPLVTEEAGAVYGDAWKLIISCLMAQVIIGKHDNNLPPLPVLHQIWANIQKYDDPPRVNLDVSGSGWRPFFGRGGIRDPGLASVQPPSLCLLPPDACQVKALQERLELCLRDAFMKWRGTNR